MRIPGYRLLFAPFLFAVAILTGCGGTAGTSIAPPASATTTTLSSSAATVSFGAPVTLTATVSPSAATGSVTFFDGTTVLGSGTLTAGVATFSTSSLSIGSHSLTASYTGQSSTYLASTSAVLTETVTAIPTTTVLTSSGTATVGTTPITLTATVSPSAATGTVTFYDGTTVLGTGTLASGVATLSISKLTVGAHTITAKYAGAGNYGGSTSNALTITGTNIATTTVLTASATTASIGTSITFTATVSPSTATGTVTFYDGTTTLGTGTLTSGVATFSTATLAGGTHSIKAVYGGDTLYLTSTSAALSVTVNLLPTTLTLVSNATTATAGTSVSFTATLSPSTLPGTITFKDGATAVGTGTLSSGVATLTLSTLTAGVHFLTANFPATSTYAAATSNAVTVTINKASTTPITGTFAGPTFSGVVMAGALPVVGASVQFYAAGTTGYGITAGTLLASAIQTDSTGSFTIPTGYLCPLPATQVYLVATGGTTTTAVNAPFEFLTALGACNALPSTVVLNEVTTASAVWSLAQFLSAGGSIGTTATNATGLANAFQIAASLASISTGTSPGTTFPANASTPAPRIDSLANLLNTCATSNAACFQFFTATYGGAATNTLDAARAVVSHPATNVATLYALSRNSSAFSPSLANAPADWTLYTVLSGNGLSGSSTLGILSTGNVWVANYYGTASQFTPLGAPAFAAVTGYGLDSSYGLAVDQFDSAWIPNDVLGGTVTKLSSDGTTGSTFSGSGMDHPVFTAVDTDTSVWVADYGNSTLTHFSNAGAPLSGPSGYQSIYTTYPTALAIDVNHNVWTNVQSGTTITRIAPDGTNPFVVECCNGPTSIAIDQRGNLWVSNFYAGTISEVSSAGTVLSTGYGGGGLTAPQSIAIDGVGNLWVANFYGVGLSELAGSQASTPGAALSPSSGFGADGPIAGGYSVSVDASGNVWVANFHSSNVIRFVGLAAPTKSPAIGPAQAP